MDRAQIPFNALRAFEAASRHLSFTRAAIELCVSQGAVSHQVALLERRLGTRLFHRLPRGLALTDDGQALVPVLVETFDRVGAVLDQYATGRIREVLNIGVVGTFATGWLLNRLDGFASAYPHIDLRISTNNNRVDIASISRRYRGGGARLRNQVWRRRLAWHLRGTAVPGELDPALCANNRRALKRAAGPCSGEAASLIPRRRMESVVQSGRRCRIPPARSRV